MRKVSSRRGGSKPTAVTVEAEISRLGHTGDGVASMNGREIFVPYTLPGEHVRAQVIDARGELLEILRESPSRVKPPCLHFGACGGCAMQHLEIAAYAAWKHSLVATALAQRGFETVAIGPLETVPPASRRRVTLAFTQNARATRLGFHRRQSHELLDIAMCPVARPEIENAIPRLRRALAAHLPTPSRGTLHVTLTESGLDVDLRFESAPETPDLELRERLSMLAEALDLARLSVEGEPFVIARTPIVSFDGVPVALPPGVFLQPSAEGEGKLIAWVREALAPSKSVIDLYAGLGTLSLPLARAASVHAVDVEGGGLAALARAAKSAGRRVTVERRDLARNPVPAVSLAAYDGAVFDPPRAGAAAQAQALAEARLPRIAAVSCNPATFARDVKILSDGGYRLVSVVPVDQFRYSAHVELVGVLDR